jgi:hypothetical protein
VFQALDFALANGYEDFLHMPAGVVAADLADLDADLEDEDTAEMAPLFTEWRLAKGLGIK